MSLHIVKKSGQYRGKVTGDVPLSIRHFFNEIKVYMHYEKDVYQCYDINKKCVQKIKSILLRTKQNKNI